MSAMTTTKRIAALLRQKGHKLTRQRRAVLEVIVLSQDHMTPAEIHKKVQEADPTIGLVTVYRTLEMLAGAGLICRVHTDQTSRSYLLRRPDEHHHHLICSDCGRVVDFTDCNLHGLEEKLSRETGFTTEGHILEFFGCCPVCQETATNTRGILR